MRKRINWLQILQAFTMLLVVMGHSNMGEIGEGPQWETVLYEFARPFRMPMFMMISGFLFFLTRLSPVDETGKYKWSYLPAIKEKAVRLLIPMAFFTLLAFAVKVAFPGEVTRQAGLSLKSILFAFLYPNDGPLREMWFIAALFWLFLLMPLWRIVLRNKWLKWGTLALVTLLHFWHPSIGPLSIDRSCENVVYFYIGLLLCESEAVDKYILPQKWLCLIIGVVLYAIGCLTHIFISTLGGILFSICLSLFLDKVWPGAFKSFRDYTYQIFLMGIFAQIAVRILYRHFGIPYLPAFVLSTVVGIYVPVLVSKLVRLINWAPLCVCLGLKPQKK